MLERVLFVCAMVLLIGCETVAIRELPIPRSLEADVDYARTIGPLMHRHLRATRLARRELPDAMANHDLVTEQVDGKGTVRVSVADAAGKEALLSLIVPAWQEGERVRTESKTSRSLTNFERAKLSAQRLAAQDQAERCGEGQELAVLAWGERGRDVFLAYRTPTAPAGQVALGGHREYLINGRGTRVERTKQLPCELVEEGTSYRRAATGKNTPSHFDVFLSLELDARLYLTTDDGNDWLVDADRVRLLAPNSP